MSLSHHLPEIHKIKRCIMGKRDRTGRRGFKDACFCSCHQTLQRNKGQKDVEQSHKPCFRWNAEAAAPSGSFVLGPSRQAASSP